MKTTFSTYKSATAELSKLTKEGISAVMKRGGDGWVIIFDKDYSDKPRATIKSEALWVGEFPQNGKLVVIDTSFKIEGFDETYGYAVERGVMRQFSTSQIQQLVPVSGDIKSKSIAKYKSWSKSEGLEFIELEQNRIKQRIDLITKKHKDYLNKIGKLYGGVTRNTMKKYRKTHCYSCKNPLESSFHIECNKCGWLICECGVCGCGYEDWS